MIGQLPVHGVPHAASVASTSSTLRGRRDGSRSSIADTRSSSSSGTRATRDGDGFDGVARGLARERVVERRAERVDVGLDAAGGAGKDLGRHEAGRADHRAGLGELGVVADRARCRSRVARRAPARWSIATTNRFPGLMSRWMMPWRWASASPLRGGESELDRERRRQRPAAPHERREVVTLEQIHRVVPDAVVGDAPVVDADDVRDARSRRSPGSRARSARRATASGRGRATGS